MRTSMVFLLVAVVVGCAMALPKTYNRRHAQPARLRTAALARPRRAPLRTMLISGYYRPYYAQRRQGFEPETAMTAFAAGGSVAAGSYLGSRAPNCASCDPSAEQDNTEYVAGGPVESAVPADQYDQTQLEAERPADFGPAADAIGSPEVPLSDEVAEVGPVEPAKAKPPKRKGNKKIKQPEDADSDDVGEEVSNRGRNNNYFPIAFHGYPLGRAGGSGGSGGSGGGVTAIANAYSTGKGGVATSHATAYGGPPPSKSRRRNNPNNNNNNSAPNNDATDDDEE